MRCNWATSASRGTLSRISVSSVNKPAIIKGSAAFFAPEIGMVPLSLAPPTMRIRSMPIPFAKPKYRARGPLWQKPRPLRRFDGIGAFLTVIPKNESVLVMGPGVRRDDTESPPVVARAGVGRARFRCRTAGDVAAGVAVGRPGKRAELFQENRLGEVKPLGIADLGRGLPIGQFFDRFDAFGDHGHAERFAQGFDRPQNPL